MAITTHTPEATAAVGETIGRALKNESGLVYLTGDLGAGKTQLTRGMVKGFGLDTLVTSPTFALVNPYSEDEPVFYHMDLYRLDDMDELMEIGFEDFLSERGIIVVEWPDMLIDAGYTPLLTIDLRRGDTAETDRVITVTPGDYKDFKSLQETLRKGADD